MNPDSFIPLYGNEFFLAVEGHSSDIGLAYLRVLWYYWSHNHCAGLKDDSEFLRRLCRISVDEWIVAKPIIFDNDQFFCMDESGLWHQKKAFEEWNKAKKRYAENCLRTQKATAARLKKQKRKS